MRAVVHSSVRKPCARAPRNSRPTKALRCFLSSFGGRPGEYRTRNAFSPPRRRASRQRITEIGAHPIRRPTSLREKPESNKDNARLRRSSSRSALPRSLGIALERKPESSHYNIIYAEINNDGGHGVLRPGASIRPGCLLGPGHRCIYLQPCAGRGTWVGEALARRPNHCRRNALALFCVARIRDTRTADCIGRPASVAGTEIGGERMAHAGANRSPFYLSARIQRADP